MAENYLFMTGGDNADNGSTWALANADLTGSMADSSVGDTTYAASGHSESYAAHTTITIPGTVGSPNILLSVDNTGNPEPPTALSAGATIATSASYALTINGSGYIHGYTFSSGGSLFFDDSGSVKSYQKHINCIYKSGTGSSSGKSIFNSSSNASASQKIDSESCQFYFSNAAHGAYIAQEVIFKNCSIHASSTALTSSFIQYLGYGGRTAFARFDGFDFTNLGSSCSLVNAANCLGSSKAIFRDCKAPPSWTGTLTTGSFPGPGPRVEAYNLDNGATNYKLWIECYEGTIVQETATYMNSGSTEGSQAISWKMTSSANVKWYGATLESPEFMIPVETTGSSKTLTLEILTDGAITTSDFSLKAMYLGSSGTPLGYFVESDTSTVLNYASASSLTTSTETWTESLTTPVEQKVSVTFTPQMAGFVVLQAVLKKASATVYVNASVA